MNKRQILDVVFIAFGLYLLVRLIYMSFHGILYLLFQRETLQQTMEASVGYYFFALLVYALVMSGLILLLLFGRDRLHRWVGRDAEEDVLEGRPAQPVPEQTAFWIRIMGVFFIVHAVPFLLSHLIFPEPESAIHVQVIGMRNTSGHAGSTVLGFLMIWQSDRLSRLILRLSGFREHTKTESRDVT